MPDFKFNPFSVSKLTKDLVCTVKFFPDFYLLQGLYSGKVIGISRETYGLYILQEEIKPLAAATVIKGKCNTILWHSRLGHTSMKAMQYIATLKGLADEQVQHECQIFPMAKQHRSIFPDSTSKTDCIFQLVHLDVWGPYKQLTYDRKY